MNNASWLHFGLLGTWILTLALTVAAFLFAGYHYQLDMEREVLPGLTKVGKLFIPQLSVMLAFFFGARRPTVKKRIKGNKPLFWGTVVCTAAYHVLFLCTLLVTVVFEQFEGRLEKGQSTFEANVSILLYIGGLTSFIAVAVVSCLFGKAKSVREPSEPVAPERQVDGS